MKQTSEEIEKRLTGSPSTRFLLELFQNSGQFALANILLESLLEGLPKYMHEPDLYTIVLASIVQAYYLSRWQTTGHPRRFLGNLIAPALYTIGESLIEGPKFFYAPHHIAFWVFALIIGSLQGIRLCLPRGHSIVAALLLIAENIIRTIILFAMYAIFESFANPSQTMSVTSFFSDSSHQFIALLTLFLGLNMGMANLTVNRFLKLLQEMSRQLKIFSEWWLGHELLGQALSNPETLTLSRHDRAVLFMDIRNFTAWSESRLPEEVVALLNRYYQTAESVLMPKRAIKVKFSADEVMAVFADVHQAASAVLELREQIRDVLAEYHLGAGIGLHHGPLVEGLLGSTTIKQYDVIGDTANTAKRIEGAAQAAEVLISDNVRKAIQESFFIGASCHIAVKGKSEPLTLYPLIDLKPGFAKIHRASHSVQRNTPRYGKRLSWDGGRGRAGRQG